LISHKSIRTVNGTHSFECENIKDSMYSAQNYKYVSLPFLFSLQSDAFQQQRVPDMRRSSTNLRRMENDSNKTMATCGALPRMQRRAQKLPGVYNSQEDLNRVGKTGRQKERETF